LAITDHVDSSNLEFVLTGLLQFVDELGAEWKTEIISGVELTHVPPRKIANLTEKAKKLGARWIVVHGETVVEPVAPGTNRAAIEAGVNLLAHPGLISPEDAKRAADLGVFLEITTRKGHSLSNGWVARVGQDAGARFLLNTDTHSPGDILDRRARDLVVMGAGFDEAGLHRIWEDAVEVVERLKIGQ
jgi:histidinol phosphatase-like PHP family hydrolase